MTISLPLSSSLQVARLFLGGGVPIVVSESRASSAPDVPRAEGAPLTTAPLTVLVNEHTASAAEILAGALKDNCRAVLVGALATRAWHGRYFAPPAISNRTVCALSHAGGKTYGKGLIQSVYELTDGSGMVLTVGETLTQPMRLAPTA